MYIRFFVLSAFLLSLLHPLLYSTIPLDSRQLTNFESKPNAKDDGTKDTQINKNKDRNDDKSDDNIDSFKEKDKDKDINEGKEATSKDEDVTKENTNATNDKEKSHKTDIDDKKKKIVEAPKPEKLLKVGNLAFPVSQQPTPLISFGQNLIEQGQLEVQFQAGELKARKAYFIDFSTSMLYAFSDNSSIYINVPNAIRYREGKHRSSGPGDALIQFEYAPYTEEFYTFYDQISLVANITLPTGSTKKNPMTGIGSNSFFIGCVYSTMSINWFYFSSYGGIFTASSHRTKFGNQFLYQLGIGNRILSTPKWLFDWMVEFNGVYSGRDKINGVTNVNSGGNIIYVTPSLFLASQKSLTVQVGWGFPVVQQLFGHQNRKGYLIQTKISWNF